MSENVTKLRDSEDKPGAPTLSRSLLDEKNRAFFLAKLAKIEQGEEKKKTITDSKAAEISAMINKGLDRHGIKRFLSYQKMDEDARHRSDLTFQYLCKISNIMLQDDLFEASLQASVDQHQAG